MERINWNNGTSKIPRTYVCGYCGEKVASAYGFQGTIDNTRRIFHIYCCTTCWKPTFFDENNVQWPFGVYGEKVIDINDQDVSALYEEARICVGFSPTAAVLACRKILMHVAVAKGAKENLGFAAYIDYLSDNNHVPQGAKDWINPIKKNGNVANHKIKIVGQEEAESTLDFTTMLLKVIYEYPAKSKKINSSPTQPSLD